MKQRNKSHTHKHQYLADLAQNLSFFYPEKQDMLLCPVCMKFIPLNQKKNISVAHIIPKHAKGNLKTFLCKKCNSDFGRAQDKWFGEFLRLRRNKQNILHSQPKQPFFHIDNIKLNGTWKVNDTNRLELLIHGPRNSPEINDYIKNHFKVNNPSKLKLQIPILGKETLIKVGFLTAAYLLFFATFGYSWALQSHLNAIREQILFPDKKIISDIIFTKSHVVEDESWIGVVNILGKYVLAAGFMGYMVLIPAINDTNFYSYFQEVAVNAKQNKVSSVGFYPMYFTNRHFYDTPVSLIFDKTLMFSPDAYIDGLMQLMTIYFSPSELKANFLFPIDDTSYHKLSKRPDAKRIKLKVRGKINTTKCLYSDKLVTKGN